MNSSSAVKAIGRVALLLGTVGLWACGGSSGGGGDDGPTGTATGAVCELSAELINGSLNDFTLSPECEGVLPAPEDNLDARLFVLGSQVDGATGDLVLYVHGTTADGDPLSVADLGSMTVQVGAVDYTQADAEVGIEAVTDGDKILSLSLVTDYSASMSDGDLDAIELVYDAILNKLPKVYEASVINFSDNLQLRLDWTEAHTDLADILAAVERDDTIPRDNTALYDAMGFALQRDLMITGNASTEGDGLIERCRPGHMLVLFTDGLENASFTYDKTQLLTLLDTSATVPIILGSETAQKEELTEFAGTRGAFVYAYNAAFVSAAVQGWADSLANLVKVTIDPATVAAPDNFDTVTVSLSLGANSTTVERPVDGFCETNGP